MKNLRFTVLFLITTLALTGSFFAQTKKRNSRKQTPKPSATIQPKQKETQSDVISTPKTSGKKNERPTDENAKNNSLLPKSTENPPVYFYEFSHPNFLVSQVFIEHDENGKGKITFLKKDFSEAVSDPIQLSAAILEKLKTLFKTLNFLESVEVYQSAERNYAHLGTMKIKLKKDGRERTAAFNWTENKEAKDLADEYRKISNQYIWMFDVGVARENQPLESPHLMDVLDALIRRNEISDSEQMIPFLKELSDDERIPLIARNHATRLMQQIENQASKNKEDKK
jgi:hypothetical protein